jgi:hypothetical protein
MKTQYIITSLGTDRFKQYRPTTIRNARKIVSRLREQGYDYVCDRVQISRRKCVTERMCRSYGESPFNALG